VRESALQTLSVVDKLNRTLSEQSSELVRQLQPTADALRHALSLDGGAMDIFSEEVVRSTAVAPLAQVLSVLEPW
jgi:alpha-glucan,water dikinase